MEPPDDLVAPEDVACPHCGEDARREETDVGILLLCEHCGFEAADQLLLDFKTD